MDWPASRDGTDRPSGPHIFSVAQHSLLVEAIARALEPELDRPRRLFMLLHDAPEYVIGDMISPFKTVIGDTYKSVEKRILTAILLRFSLPRGARSGAPAARQARGSRRGFFRGGASRRLYTRRGRAHLRPPGGRAGRLRGRARSARRRGGAAAVSRPFRRDRPRG